MAYPINDFDPINDFEQLLSQTDVEWIGFLFLEENIIAKCFCRTNSKWMGFEKQNATDETYNSNAWIELCYPDDANCYWPKVTYYGFNFDVGYEFSSNDLLELFQTSKKKLIMVYYEKFLTERNSVYPEVLLSLEDNMWQNIFQQQDKISKWLNI